MLTSAALPTLFWIHFSPLSKHSDPLKMAASASASSSGGGAAATLEETIG